MRSVGYAEISTQDVDGVGEIWGGVGTLHDKSVDHFLLWRVVSIWIVCSKIKCPRKYYMYHPVDKVPRVMFVLEVLRQERQQKGTSLKERRAAMNFELFGSRK